MGRISRINSFRLLCTRISKCICGYYLMANENHIIEYQRLRLPRKRDIIISHTFLIHPVQQYRQYPVLWRGDACNDTRPADVQLYIVRVSNKYILCFAI